MWKLEEGGVSFRVIQTHRAAARLQKGGTAMRKPTASPTRQSTPTWETLEEWVHEQVRAFVQRVLEDEVTGICGAGEIGAASVVVPEVCACR